MVDGINVLGPAAGVYFTFVVVVGTYILVGSLTIES